MDLSCYTRVAVMGEIIVTITLAANYKISFNPKSIILSYMDNPFGKLHDTTT